MKFLIFTLTILSIAVPSKGEDMACLDKYTNTIANETSHVEDLRNQFSQNNQDFKEQKQYFIDHFGSFDDGPGIGGPICFVSSLAGGAIGEIAGSHPGAVGGYVAGCPVSLYLLSRVPGLYSTNTYVSYGGIVINKGYSEETKDYKKSAEQIDVSRYQAAKHLEEIKAARTVLMQALIYGKGPKLHWLYEQFQNVDPAYSKIEFPEFKQVIGDLYRSGKFCEGGEPVTTSRLAQEINLKFSPKLNIAITKLTEDRVKEAAESIVPKLKESRALVTQ